MPDRPVRSVLAALLILVGFLAAGPGWATSGDIGEGTATARIVEPTWLADGSGPAEHRLRAQQGRFGTAAWYVRTPAVVLDVTNVTGSPELYYDVSIPGIDADPAPVRRHLAGPGRYRLAPADVALPPAGYEVDRSSVDLPADGTYTGRLEVRVRSFSTSHVVANRTVEVVVDR